MNTDDQIDEMVVEVWLDHRWLRTIRLDLAEMERQFANGDCAAADPDRPRPRSTPTSPPIVVEKRLILDLRRGPVVDDLPERRFLYDASGVRQRPAGSTTLTYNRIGNHIDPLPGRYVTDDQIPPDDPDVVS